MQKQFNKLLQTIKPADRQAMEQAKKRWNSIAKPIGSLGLLEDMIISVAGITGDAAHMDLNRSALLVLCADHGVVAEGVTQTGQEVTRIVAENFTKRKTSVTVMCEVSKTDVFPVDIGMLGEPSGSAKLKPFSLADRKIAQGSGNIVREPAMTKEQCIQALLTGIHLVRDLKDQGYPVIAAGEMGIGNTTPSSALAAALCGMPPKAVVGRGAGLSDAGLARKQEAVEQAVERFAGTGKMNTAGGLAIAGFTGPENVITLLAELGGYDIAGLTGVFLGSAVYRVPIIMDGLISTTAALCAVRIHETVKDFLLASHISAEPGGQLVMNALGLHAPLACNMHLGEGSGAVAVLPLLQMAARVYETMSTFEEIEVEPYLDYGEKQKE